MTDDKMNKPIDPDDPWAKIPVNSQAGEGTMAASFVRAQRAAAGHEAAESAGAPSGVDAADAGAVSGAEPDTGAGASSDADAAAEPDAGDPVEDAQAERRRKLARRASWVLLIAGLLTLLGIVAYYAGTCAYTAVQQSGLRDELADMNPLLETVATSFDESDFTHMSNRLEEEALAAASAAEKAAAEAALRAAEEKRLAELKALWDAADAFERQVVPGQAIGRIVIPKIDVDVVMVEGVGRRFLKEGPGHWNETPFPGQVGNFVVSGHRTTYGAPFFKLNELEAGDEIQIILPYVIAKYTVTRVVIVYPKEVDEVAQLGREQVSLAACHPIYSAKQRILVQGDLTSFVLLDQDGAQSQQP